MVSTSPTPTLGPEFFATDPLTCARALLGCELRWDGCAGTVLETEAYTAEGDESCHTFLRRGARRFVAEHAAGTAYVYQNYGIHWLLNVLIKSPGGGAADGFVLVRALLPTLGLDRMRARRGLDGERLLCAGPGRLTVALGIGPGEHGKSLCEHPDRGFALPMPGITPPTGEIVAAPRIGISRAADFPWRLLYRGNPFVSRPAPRPRVDPLTG